jgi:hypothetical protein
VIDVLTQCTTVSGACRLLGLSRDEAWGVMERAVARKKWVSTHPHRREISEQLDIVSAQVRVLQHVRGKYACKACAQTVRCAPLPAQPIPKSLASPGLLAHITVAKYQDALPLYRQETILKRLS